MWKWMCPKNPLIVYEHHSMKSLDESLTSHENGIDIPGVINFPPCDEIHDYWDDGEPCRQRRCNRRYIPETSSERR